MTTLDLLKTNKDFERYCTHWANNEGKTIDEVACYKISELYAKQLLEKENLQNEEYEEVK